MTYAELHSAPRLIRQPISDQAPVRGKSMSEEHNERPVYEGHAQRDKDRRSHIPRRKSDLIWIIIYYLVVLPLSIYAISFAVAILAKNLGFGL